MPGHQNNMKDFTSSKIFKEIIKNKIPCYFISPHLDDAIFSVGGLMHTLNGKGIPLTIVNVFTSASKPPYTLSIKKFLNSCGYKNADDLYKDRIIEDSKVADKINAKVINLGFTDALWRRKDVNGVSKIISSVIPEFGYVYPIYRTSIAKGNISAEDTKLQNSLMIKLQNLVTKKEKFVIFGSAGVGKHTDHLITRNALSKLKQENVIYWGDYPYFEKDEINSDFKNKLKLKEYIFHSPEAAKRKLVMGYGTQITAIFGTKKIDTSKELFYLKSDE